MTLPPMNPSTFAAPPANDSQVRSSVPSTHTRCPVFLVKPEKIHAARVEEGDVFAGVAR